jgi:hypothetical protein
MEDFDKANLVGDEVLKTADKISKLGTEALSASAAGFVILAWFWSFFWVFAAMTLAVLLVRGVGLLAARKNQHAASERELFDWVMERKKELWESTLPDLEKARVSQHLDLMLKPIDIAATQRQLPSAPIAETDGQE